MEVSNIVKHSVHELVEKIKNVTMLHDREAMPYKRAVIQVSDVHTKLLAPAQLYVLKDEFEKVRALRWAMLDHGVDIIRLADTRLSDGAQLGYIEFTVGEPPTKVTLLPPVVEVSKEADGTQVLIINDGMHRCFLARVSHVIPAVVRVENVPIEYPYYAYPLADGWAGVQMVDKLSKGKLKKFHRRQAYHKLYRDFNSVFENVGGPRGYTK